MLIFSGNNVVGLLALAVVVISARIRDSDEGRTNVIDIGRNSDEEVIFEADLNLQPRDKRTIGAILSGIGDLFGYDVQRRPSVLPVQQPAVAVAPASNLVILDDPNAAFGPDLARQTAPAAPPPAAPAPAAPAPGPVTPPATLTAGVRRAFQLGVNWSNQRQQLGGAPPPAAPAAPAPAAPAPPPAAPAPPPAAAPPPPPPIQGERRAYTVGLNWQNLRTQLGGAPPAPAPAAPPPAGAAPPPAAAGPPPPQGFRQSYQVGFDFSNQRQQLGAPPPPPAAAAPPPPAAAPPPPAAAPPPAAPAAAQAGRPIANLGTPQRRVPELIRENPLTPLTNALVERIYSDNDATPPKKNKIYYPKEIDFDRPNPLRGTAVPKTGYILTTTVASSPIYPPIKLDTPPAERDDNEVEEEEDNASEEEESANETGPAEEKKLEKEMPRGFGKAPSGVGWKKEETGDPKEEVYVLEEDYTYGDKPKKVQIDLPDYSDEAPEQKRNNKAEEKNFEAFKANLSPKPLSLLQRLTDELPEDIKQFNSEFRHYRSVRSLPTYQHNLPQTRLLEHHRSIRSIPSYIHQDTIALLSPTLTRNYLVHHDSEPAENIEAARKINRNILNYYSKKFFNDALQAHRAIQNPHLINEPHYQNLEEPHSIYFKEEDKPDHKQQQESEKAIKSEKTYGKGHVDVQREHQDILNKIANNFENQKYRRPTHYITDEEKRQKVKEYYSKALDGIVKNFEQRARDELTTEERLANQHKELLDDVKEKVKNTEPIKNEKEDEGEENEKEQPNEEEDTAKLEKEPIKEAKEGRKEQSDSVTTEKPSINVEKEPNEEEEEREEESDPVTTEKPSTNVEKETIEEEDEEAEEEQSDSVATEKPSTNVEQETIEEAEEERQSDNDDDGKVKVGNEDVVGPNDELENIRNDKSIEAPKKEAIKEDEEVFDITYFLKPSDFVKELEKTIYPEQKESYFFFGDDKRKKVEENTDKANEEDEEDDEEVTKNDEDNKSENNPDEEEEDDKTSKNDEKEESRENETESTKKQEEDGEESEKEPPSDQKEALEKNENNSPENPQQQQEGESEEDDEEEETDEEAEARELEEKKRAEEETEKLREQEEKRRKEEEKEKELKKYIEEHFEVDEVNGVPVPNGVKDTPRYKQIVEEVKRPLDEQFFTPKEFSFEDIDGYFGQKYEDNVQKLDKANNRVEEEEEEAAETEDEDQPKKAVVEDEDSGEKEEDADSGETEDDSEKEDDSSETEDDDKDEKEESKTKEQLLYPHERRAEEIYSNFRQKLTNPETQDTKTYEVIQPILHTGTFKPSGVEVLESPAKLLSVPIDYDYSSSEKKVVVEGSGPKRVRRQVYDIKWGYQPETYDPSFTYVIPEPKIIETPKIEVKHEGEALSPNAFVTESESGRRKTYIRVNRKEEDMYV